MKSLNRCLVTLGLMWVCFCHAALEQSYKQWEQDIRAFEASDKADRPPHDAILFVGSSSFRIWKDVAHDFPEYKVINRGFGGSQISDINHYLDRIVTPYQPKLIVFYAGDNDLRSLKPEDVYQEFKTFADRVHWSLPKTSILFLSIKPSLARWKNKDNIERANQLIETYSREKDYVTFVDLFPVMLDKSGNPRPELFQKDGLHMNRKGYELWISKLSPIFKEFSRVHPEILQGH